MFKQKIFKNCCFKKQFSLRNADGQLLNNMTKAILVEKKKTEIVQKKLAESFKTFTYSLQEISPEDHLKIK